MLLVLGAATAAEIPLSERRSGYEFMSRETRAMQDDDITGPAVLALLDGEAERPVAGFDVDGAEVGAGRQSVGDRVMAGGCGGGALVVDADDLRTRGLGEVAVERVDDAFEPSVVVEVVDLDVGQDRGEQR